MSRHYRRPTTSIASNVSSSTNQTLIRYRPSDEECQPSPSSVERDSRPDTVYRQTDDLCDLFENPTPRDESIDVTVDPYEFEPSPSPKLTAKILGNLAHNTEIARYPPTTTNDEASRYSTSKATTSIITIPQPKSVSASASTVRKPPPSIKTPIPAPRPKPKQQPPPVESDSDTDSDNPSSESESSSESSVRNARRPTNANTDDSDSLIVPLPNETKSQKKERKRAEKKEVEDLVKKNKKKIMRLVSCCLVPIGAISLLRRAIEALM